MMIFNERQLFTRGGRIWRFDCISVYVICDLTALKPDLKRVNNKKTCNSQAIYVIKTNRQERDIAKQPQSMMVLGSLS